MSLTYIQVTEDWNDGSGQPVSGTVTFTPSQTVYASGIPLVTPANPVQAQITGGQLRSQGGGTVQLLSTSNAGLSIEGSSGFWFWTVDISITSGGGTSTDTWQFFLALSPSSVDLYSTRNSPVSGGLTNPMTTLGDMISGGASGTPARLAGNTASTVDVLTSTGSGGLATAPAWQNGYSLYDAAGTAALTGAAGTAYAQVIGAAGTAYTNQYAAPISGTAMTGPLSPGVSALTQAAGTVAVNARAGNVFNGTLTASGWMIATPSNPLGDGQIIRFRLTQGTAAPPYTVNWGTGYDFGSGTSPTLSTTGGLTDIAAYEYVAAIGRWCFLGAGTGF